MADLRAAASRAVRWLLLGHHASPQCLNGTRGVLSVSAVTLQWKRRLSRRWRGGCRICRWQCYSYLAFRYRAFLRRAWIRMSALFSTLPPSRKPSVILLLQVIANKQLIGFYLQVISEAVYSPPWNVGLTSSFRLIHSRLRNTCGIRCWSRFNSVLCSIYMWLLHKSLGRKYNHDTERKYSLLSKCMFR